MAADRELLAIVWGETWGLSPKDGNDQTRTHLQAVVTSLAAVAKQRGLGYKLTKRLAPRSDNDPETAVYSAMRATANAVADAKWLPQIPLPARAVLWEINDNGAPRRDPALPASAAWIYEFEAAAGGDFIAGTGPDQRTYRLFESATSSARDDLPYLSGYTGSGTSAAAADAKAKAGNRRIAWILGCISAIVFVIGGVSAVWSGQRDGVARSYIMAPSQQTAIVNKLKDSCLADAKLFPNWKRRACNFLEDANGKLVPPPVAPQEAATGETPPSPPTPTSPAKQQPPAGAARGKQPTDPASTPAPPAAASTAEAVQTLGAPDASQTPAASAEDKSAPAAAGAKKKVADSAAPETAPVYLQRVGETIALIKNCLNVGAAPASGSGTNPAATQPSTEQQQQAAADAAADETASCELIARSAAGVVVVAPTQSSIDNFVRSLLGLRTAAGSRSIIVQFLAMTLGIAGLAVALGLGTKGRIVGIWVDERNRVSLARAQVTLWTMIALGGFAAIALYNIGLGAPINFPGIPTSIIAALGIAFGSPMLSALILDRQPKSSALDSIKGIGQMSSSPNNFVDREVRTGDSDAKSNVEERALPSDASLADIFVGEHVADCNQVDISRLQNVVLTATLVLGYFTMLLERLGGILPESVLWGLPSLPDAGATFTSVLLVSHATYLGTKVYASAGTSQEQH